MEPPQISVCQHYDDKENVPPFFSVAKTSHGDLPSSGNNSKTNKYRKPLQDVTHLIIFNSPIQSTSSPSFSRLQSVSSRRSDAGNRVSMEERRCRAEMAKYREGLILYALGTTRYCIVVLDLVIKK
ncbi:hypothetical protein L6452_15552 [Arctium lappa]|uniref:Uncharacterized protein n=1 Tax=Arctium lappa TaxID=4217 RepID=A0ACB9CP09_ARCLA|nr:hypothetical protein L6452_15552 [Arctium lappa]